jgi:2,3-bisphosphoglycerate-dependent phosphoglycerate mutase
MTNPEARAALGVPEGIRTTSGERGSGTRVVLVRHGEAVCNVSGVVGGRTGCRGLTDTGRSQVAALAARLARTGELGAVDAFYSSPLLRARETAAILAPALNAWRSGPPLVVVEDCDFCELHPGESDGLSWGEYEARFPLPDWDKDPTTPIAPGGESWSGFVDRAATAVAALATAHPGETVVVACHAGVVESSILRLLPVDRSVARLRLRTTHASLTVWEHGPAGWLLQRYNDTVRPEPSPTPVVQQA